MSKSSRIKDAKINSETIAVPRLSPEKLQELKDRLEADTKEFLAKGGKIEEIVYDEEKIIAGLKSKYSKLTSKTNSFNNVGL